MDSSPASMVGRIELIMGVFERSTGPLTLGQISSSSKLPRSSVHRIILQLLDARWLLRADEGYVLGLRMFELGARVQFSSRLSNAARALMQDLWMHTGHVVHFAVLDGTDVVYLDKVGENSSTSLPSRVGGRLPAHCTGVGKAILAFSPQHVVDDYVESGLPRRTSASITDAVSLKSVLQRARDRGIATENNESVPGIACIAAPIVEYGYASAAISVCGPAQKILVPSLRNRLLWTAAEIGKNLSIRPRQLVAV